MNAVLALALLAPAAEPVPQSDATTHVARGLKWLADQQKPDGSWDGGTGCTVSYATTRAGIALLMEGSTASTGKYAEHISKALAWVEERALTNGRFAGDQTTENGFALQLHAHALLFLVCAYDADGDPVRARKRAALIERGIAYALSQQSERGGWRLEEASPEPTSGDRVAQTDVLNALLAARKAGFRVPKKALDLAVAYLGGPETDRRAGGPISDPTRAAAALVTGAARGPALNAWLASARAHVPNVTNYSEMIGLESVCTLGCALGETGHRRFDATVRASHEMTWPAVRAKAYTVLVAAQAKDGSWPDAFGSPVVATASALTTLQLDNGYLPAFTR